MITKAVQVAKVGVVSITVSVILDGSRVQGVIVGKHFPFEKTQHKVFHE